MLDTPTATPQFSAKILWTLTFKPMRFVKPERTVESASSETSMPTTSMALRNPMPTVSVPSETLPPRMGDWKPAPAYTSPQFAPNETGEPVLVPGVPRGKWPTSPGRPASSRMSSFSRAVSSAPPWASAIEAVIIPRTAAIPSDLRIEPMCLLSDKERGYEGIEVGRFTAQQNTVPAKAGPTCYATMFRTWRGLSIDGDNARHNHAKGLSALSFGRQTADGGFQKLRALSSAVEQRTHNPTREGSTPSGPMKAMEDRRT